MSGGGRLGEDQFITINTSETSTPGGLGTIEAATKDPHAPSEGTRLGTRGSRWVEWGSSNSI